MEISSDISSAAKVTEEATVSTLVPKEERPLKEEEEKREEEVEKMLLKVEKEPSTGEVVEAELSAQEHPEDMEITHTDESVVPQTAPPAEAKCAAHKPSVAATVSDDLSPGVAQAPLSPLASPAEPVPDRFQLPDTDTEPPFSPVDFSTALPPAMFLPMTPKIGMGKPAITKRKFSPGRPRVKQGAWRGPGRAVSPSWSLEPPKTRQPTSTPAWGIRVGRGSGFPGRRRPRGAGLSGRGGRGRSRMKNGVGPVPTPGVSAVEPSYLFKEEEENVMHNTVVLFSSSDTFTLRQDMCVVCGSFGQGVEGRLLACAQCGQCYHPFCVNIKITRVVLSKGWRCLECTVCEACGQATDPARLLLCDDCDISYHTYCLDPPLQNVPNGGWKCKWCVSCIQCGATSPGLRGEWQNNYTQCSPCASLSSCPICLLDYSEEEIIVQCRQCDRWVHASCQGLHSEQEVEVAVDNGFDCTQCRGRASPSETIAAVAAMAAAEAYEPPLPAQTLPKARDLDPARTYTQDGVCLTESGLSQLQSLAAAASRRRRPKPKLKLKIINQNSVAVLQTLPDQPMEMSRDGDMEDNREGEVECEGKSDSSPEREVVDDDSKGVEAGKKRKRKPYRPGIGGFMVRQRNKAGNAKVKPTLTRKDSTGSLSEIPPGKDEAWGDPAPDTPQDEKPPAAEFPEKTRKRYRKKKTKLEEAFPTYLQEAFFGKDLLDKSKQSRQGAERGLLEEERMQTGRKTPRPQYMSPSADPLLSTMPTAAGATTPGKAATSRSADDPLVALSDVLSTDTDLLGILSGDLGKPSDDSAGLDMAEETPSVPQPHQGRAARGIPEEPLDGILSPELDKMVTDESILSKLYKIPELEGKDVEDLFTAVLSPSTSQSPQVPQQQHGSAPLHGPHGVALPHPPSAPGNGMFPRMPMVNGLMDPSQPFSPSQMNPGAGPCMRGNFSPLQRMPFPENMGDHKFHAGPGGVGGAWSGPGPAPGAGSGAGAEGEGDSMSNAQKSTLKWEKEETLGELATVAPVLYTNVNFPNLKEEYPDWSTRVKQIAKLWRKASSQDRAPYVQKARDNRAALRINKVQMSNDPIKRPHPQQMPPLPQAPEVFDPAIPPLDTELLFKDPLKHKESEQEQEWKLRQQMRQKSKQQAKIEATQKLEQVKNEQLQQQQQQQQQTGSGDMDASSSGQSPLSSQPGSGNASPMQQHSSKTAFSRPQAPGAPSDDIFLRPQPPPPSAGSQGSSSQPQSPQMFSPGSSGSMPSSPGDPYAKMVGTPRPPSMGPNGQRRSSVESGKSPRSLSEERGKPASAHEPFGSPTSLSSDPYAKPPDTPRPVTSGDPFLKPMGPPRASSSMDGRHMMGSPGHDPFSRPAQRKEIYQRAIQSRMILPDPCSRPLLTPIPGSNESGSVQLFKAPMPPGQAQDPYGGMHPGQRRPGGDPFERVNPQDDPYAQPPLTPRPAMGQEFANPQRPSRQAHQFPQPGPVMRQSAQNPYVHAPPTPRPDYSQYDPYAQPPGTPRPMTDPYAHPPGTPRPHDQYNPSMGTPSPSSDPYSHPPSTPRPGPRVSPSLAVDPYAQQPGTPHPGVGDRFPKSPSCQRNSDPYAQPPGTPRPMAAAGPQPMLNDPYAQPPGTPRPGARTGPMASQDPFSSAQGRAQEAFAHPMAPGSQTPKHPGIHDENIVLPPSNPPNQTPVHDPFEQAPMTPHPQAMEKEQQGMVGHGPNTMGAVQLPHTAQFPTPASEPQSVSLMEAEERMRQRQRIRELILKQQQQKGANRQEKGPQEAPMAMAQGPPQQWSQGGPGPQAEMFSRPPPPYPGPGPVRGPMRFPGPFPSDQHGHVAMEGQFPDGANMGIRQHMQRFAFPGGQGPHGPPRPPHPMQEAMMDPHAQMRRSMSVDLGKPFGGPPMGPQHFPPRGMPVQQHNIMGQPFIELRHRAPENRLRLPFGPAGMQGTPIDPHLQQHRPPGFNIRQQMGFPPNQGPRPMDGTMMTQPQGTAPVMQMSASMDNLNQTAGLPGTSGLQQAPLMRSLSQPAPNEASSIAPANLFPGAPPVEQTDEIPIPSGDGEKLDADESAVKDLEDVEVKDLVDADLENLNLDPEDGKDLDLETNDLHLDDFLTSGKFDIIAYTDPDLDLDVKKDMFNEDLDLSDPIEDHSEADSQKTLSDKRNTSSDAASAKGQSDSTPEAPKVDIKQEAGSGSQGLKEDPDIKTEVSTDLPQPQGMAVGGDVKSSNLSQPAPSQPPQPGSAPDSTPVLSCLLVKEKAGDSSMKQADTSSAVQNNPEVAISNVLSQSNFPQQDLNSSIALEQAIGSNQGETPLGNPDQIQGQASGQAFGAEQARAQDVMLAGDLQAGGSLSQAQQSLLGQNRPLLLEEQPLLLQDLLDQERQEQQQQRQMQAMIRQRSSDSFFPNIDFDAITDPIMKAKMVALKGINKVMVQNNMGMTPMVMNRLPQAVQQGPGPQWPDGAPGPQQIPVQDVKQAPHMGRPNPPNPNIGPGFGNDAQKAQYEEWLRETQQLLQMQQKFLEEQIGAHRKSKKALSAKQRTAKKAGREFPEEDAEQLKHVTEQQGVVQKQLEQIRKQQKEHAELIEEYRVKQQQQCNMQPPMMPGMHGPPAMMPVRPPMGQPMMGPVPQMPQMPVHPGQPGPARPPNMPGWRPGAPMPMPGPPMPMGGPRMPPGMLPSQGPMPPQSPQVIPAAAPPPQPGGESPHVNFDDTNPFSEGFQERERKERLREQQERQRVQLMKEVERQRALKQRMEMEMQQQAMMSPEGLMKPQMPMFNQDMPHDFMQSQKPQQQQQMGMPGQMFPQQQGHQPGPSGESPAAFMGNGPFPQDMGPGFWPDNPGMEAGNFAPGQPRPPRFGGPNVMHQTAGKSHPFGPDSSLPLPPNFPGSGPSLIQLYSNIIPEEKGKKKRNRKKKKDDDSVSLNAPSTPHSDLTAPLTPCVSDTSSTPTRLSLHHGEQDLCESSQPGSSTPGSATSQPPSELERQLSGGSCGGGGGSFPLLEGHSGMASGSGLGQDVQDRILSNIKLEQVEGASECHGPRGHEMEHVGMVKAEKDGASPHAAGLSPAHSSKGEMSNELLKHLLKNKRTPPAGLPHQRSEDSLRSEEDGSIDNKGFLRQNSVDSNGTVSDSQLSGHPEFGSPSMGEQEKRKQRNKRGPKGGERPTPRSKKRKKEEEERQAACATSDSVMTHLKQLSLLPLMEPLIGVNYAHFVPYGSRQLDGDNRLSGSFGSASLDGVSDYYSQLIYKQNNLSNPPTPPASLPPTPPPVARQKILNGFATTEELASKAVMGGHDVTKGLLPRSMHVQLKAEEELLARALSQGPKTVDVPASLPTPPHNNQEEISRGQEHCEDRDSPDSFVPSSSPESVVGMEISRYPDLSLVKQERPSPSNSPVIPLLPSCSGKGGRLLDIKKEQPSMFYGPPFEPTQISANTSHVAIAITLKPAAAENITGVVAAIADLLRVKVPSSYEVSSGPDRPLHGGPGGLRASLQGPELRHPFMLQGAPGGFRGPEGGGMHFVRPPPQHRPLHMHHPQQPAQMPPDRGAPVSKEQFLKGQASPGPKPQWCRHCKVVVLGSGVRKSPKDAKSAQQDLQSAAEGDVVFCSHSCLILHSSSSPAKPATDTKESVELLPETEPKESPSRAQHPYSNNMSSLDVHCLAQLQPKPSPPPPTSPLPDPPSPHEVIKAEAEPEPKPSEVLRVTVKLKARGGGGSGSMEHPSHHAKRPKVPRWQKWSLQLQVSVKKEGDVVGSTQLIEDEAEVDRLLAKLAAPLRPNPPPRDRRRCCFCHQEGDGLTDGPARLLNLDLDTWVHLNCALWSTEVYETQAGALINVELALRRGTAILCVYCQRTGATTGCHRLRCLNVYHFTCALQAGCTFFKDKTMLCHAHRPRGQGNAGSSSAAVAATTATSALLEHQLRCFSVFRRVYVQRDEVRQLAGAVQRPERGYTFRVGSLVFHTMGQLLPAQMPAFHSEAAIFPVGYEASRLYWSMRHSNRRCRYLCSVEERGTRPEFTIRVQEPGYEELVLTDSSPKGVWDKVLGPVAERRAESGTLRLFPVYLKGEDLFGLTVSAVTRIAESLPGVEACKGYRFRYGRNPMLEVPLAVNLCGSARAQPRSRPRHDRLLDVCTASSRTIQNSAPQEGGSPYSKHFVHSKSSQYRRLQSEWKANVYLAHSRIQGLGLFAARDIEKQTMVIEYFGNILRNEVACRKEFLYKCQNRAVYMFRIDAEHVLDATLTGGMARYINHSCAPNCVAEVVTFERGYKVIISSNRRIEKGEELCYDYRFEQAGDQHKIPCHCGGVNCRKWMN
ncbi:hypothetical protein ACEWY4_006944 [Coilia grayii]|uniref:Histone-lysine N-methyltransferase 2C n=1 Tax=Coilia grayii TaxID=363190 RepID=A0ABD1KF18_9TELE